VIKEADAKIIGLIPRLPMTPRLPTYVANRLRIARQ